MISVVVDTSVVVKWFFQESESDVAEAMRLLEWADLGKVQLFSSELLRYELGNVLIKKKSIPSQQLVKVLEYFNQLDLSLVRENQELATLTFQLAKQYNLTYYDAAFVGVAMAESSPLVTANYKHQGKVTQVPVLKLSQVDQILVGGD